MTKRYGLHLAVWLTTLSLLLPLAFGQPVIAQTSNTLPTIPWVATLPAEPLAIAADGPRGSYVLLRGNTILQLDTKGKERWRQTFTDWPTIQRIVTDGAGRLTVTGPFTGQFTIADSTYQLEEAFQRSTFVAQFDSTHARRWVTYVLARAGLLSQATSLATDQAGAVFVYGRESQRGGPLLAHFDADGRFIDAQAYGAPIIPAPDPGVVVADASGHARLTISERSSRTTYGLLAATDDDDTLRWQTYLHTALGADAAKRYDTEPIGLALDKQDNGVVLANYTLRDRLVGLTLETGQLLLRYNGDGQNQWVKTGVTRPDSAIGSKLVVDPAGAFVVAGGYDGPYDPQTNTYGPADYLSLAGYAPTGQIRWTYRLNATNGNDRLIGTARADNGALLLLGKTTGTLPLESMTLTASATAPAYYLANLQPFQLRPAAGSVTLCAGSTATIKGTYRGYFEQAPVLQLSDNKGSFDKAQPIVSVPIGVPGNLFSVSDFALSIPLAASATPGAGYLLRAISPLPIYTGDPVSVTIAVAPPTPRIAQTGDELGISGSVTAGLTYQWYSNNQVPVPGATGPTFKPTSAGAYFVVATANGCGSVPSEALNYVITATETAPTITVYPNPATHQLWVRWPFSANQPQTGYLRLTTLTGQTVRQLPRTGELTEVPLTDLAAGLYLLSMQANGQPAEVHKVWVK
ncbi:T9SS type A sorting domain-containing protein [Fibrella aquatilis]|uniref:T9SS type A sorting domain-containing protein n=1 Tax=Fibrella aquatilis TaxID=2817059 RepID=A0A939G648_9BACT|nr:T9SS type A sorting domain-containing protein [Fibrella aquatilis]MBO0932854.1 T9SS type A sorting domain-containing protein [Fibrella aquatilis]